MPFKGNVQQKVNKDCLGCLMVNRCDRTCSVFYSPSMAWDAPIGCKAKRTTIKQIERDEKARRAFLALQNKIDNHRCAAVIVAGAQR